MADIRQTVFIASKAEFVFDALTTQSGLASWWTPDCEPVENGWRFHFGETYFKQMQIVHADSKSIRWKCVAGAAEWIGTDLSFELESDTVKNLRQSHPELSGQLDQTDTTEGTVLRFTHENWKSESAMFAECSYTWGQFLRSLKLYCETGIGTSWPTQHKTR